MFNKPSKDKEEAITRAAIYVRVSTEEQAQTGFSIEAQKEKLTAFCKVQGWNIFKIYVDDGYSGKDLKRPRFQELFSDANNKYFDVVLVYKLDRLSRRLGDLTDLGEKFDMLNIGLRSATEPFDTTNPAGKLFFNMLGSFAQFERELISERTRMGCLRRIKEGLWGTTAPFGYDLKEGRLHINKDEAALVKIIYDMFLEKNLGLELISRKMNENDISSKKNGKWHKNTISHILTNPVYIGQIRWSKDIVKGQHEPILTQEMFEDVQKRLKEKDKTGPWFNTSPNIFIGLIFCSKCGKPMSSRKPGNGSWKGKYRYYACVGRKQAKCNQDSVRADILEDAILNKIREIASHPEIINQYLSENIKTNEKNNVSLISEKLSLKQNITQLEQLKDKKIKSIVYDCLSPSVTKIVGSEVDGLLEKIENLKDKLRQVEIKSEQINFEGVNAEIIANFLNHFNEVFSTMDTAQKKLLINSIVKKIVVFNKNKIDLTLTIPVSDPKSFGIFEDIGVADGI